MNNTKERIELRVKNSSGETITLTASQIPAYKLREDISDAYGENSIQMNNLNKLCETIKSLKAELQSNEEEINNARKTVQRIQNDYSFKREKFRKEVVSIVKNTYENFNDEFKIHKKLVFHIRRNINELLNGEHKI